ncbi:hypothetical protein DSM21852_31110 [Methylocystis bryophila]|uniref:Uncharacterized protein n=2 Tax=Methylocystis bryophila TaxID=655015 RepID=A0A1W6MQY2_9HYPH|nr:hypothetical protein B1812_01435 [Methylocystis bryophila]BDV39858.1 hypothetical protein DSM21852_31110 [Methylocystis bryophila]
MRQAVLATILLAFVVGVLLRFGPHRLAPDREELHRPTAQIHPQGERLGNFVVEHARDQTRLSLSLRSPLCRAPVYVTSGSVFGSAPERLMAFRFPEPPWRTVYVYQGRALGHFSRFDALLDFFWGRLKAQLSLSRLDAAESTYFTFRMPAECRLSNEALLAVSRQILERANRGAGPRA